MRNTSFSVLLGLFMLLFGTVTAEAATMTNLSQQQKAIIPIAALTAKGDIPNLKTAFVQGLDAGLTVNEIKEVLVQMYAYAGFPRSLNGLGAFGEVLKEREDKGIKDTVGKEASPLPAGKTSLELGTAVQTQLVGAPVNVAISPAIDEYLKAHLFGDIFGRDVLDYQSRELATVAALASLEGVGAQLRSHSNIAMNVGLTPAQMEELVSVLADKVGKTEGGRARQALDAALASRK